MKSDKKKKKKNPIVTTIIIWFLDRAGGLQFGIFWSRFESVSSGALSSETSLDSPVRFFVRGAMQLRVLRIESKSLAEKWDRRIFRDHEPID